MVARDWVGDGGGRPSLPPRPPPIPPVRAPAAIRPPASHTAHALAPPPAPGPDFLSAPARVPAPLVSRQPGPAPPPRPPLCPPCPAPSVRRRPLLRVRGARRRPEERASCRWRPAAPDKLAICCCLSSAFVMQIPEPAAGTKLGGGGVFLPFFFLSSLSLCSWNC